MALLSAVVLLVQISATRLLSATVAYHAAFAVLALVMLALAGSATAVYRDRSRAGSAPLGLDPAARMASFAGPVVAATGLVYIAVGAVSWPGEIYQAAHFAAAAIGFYSTFHICGYVVAWLLSSWPEDIGRVYFADLVGAAAGCLVAVPALTAFAPVQLLCICGAVASGAGVLLAGSQRDRRNAIAATAVLVGVAVVVVLEPSWVRLRSAKHQDQASVLFEKWNPLARVTVSPEMPGTLAAVELLSTRQSPEQTRADMKRWSAGWGISEKWKGAPPEAMWIELDTDAGTQILEGGGTRPLADFDTLKWDVTAAAYWLAPGGLDRTFVIGGGGGRDFLTALAFGARHVDVVELNPLVVRAVETQFGDYSGRPYSRAGVSYRLGDARSELSRTPERYDLIQMSMIDTWAASMTGALMLSENALYTREAFHSYLSHLTEDGIFAVSRWYGADTYAETARVIALMGEALRSAGVSAPEDHIAVVFNASSPHQSWVATCMMKQSALTDADRSTLARVADEKGFAVLWPPTAGGVRHRMDIAALARGDLSAAAADGFDVTPPTDERPFFFYTSRTSNGGRVPILFGSILAIALVAGRILVFSPLKEIEASRPPEARFTAADAPAEIAYFAAIGMSFMAVELGVLQRYIVFLGHPTYALSVVLFSLLLSTALGSLLVARWRGVARIGFPALLAMLALTIFVVPGLLEAWHGWPLASRVFAAAALIVPLGVCMGTALPTGIATLSRAGSDRLVPWMWAINGLAGTIASVAGMFLAMETGYTVLLFVAAIGYVGAWLALQRFRPQVAA